MNIFVQRYNRSINNYVSSGDRTDEPKKRPCVDREVRRREAREIQYPICVFPNDTVGRAVQGRRVKQHMTGRAPTWK